MSRRRLPLLVPAVLAMSLILVTVVSANANIRINWYAFSGGGGHSGSAHYSLNGTMGQPVAGLASSTHFQLGGGFWYVLGVPQVTVGHLYLPVLLRRYP